MTIFTECNTEDLINLSQAARLLEVSRPTVYGMIKRSELSLVLVAGLPYVDIGEVEELKRRRSGDEQKDETQNSYSS